MNHNHSKDLTMENTFGMTGRIGKLTTQALKVFFCTICSGVAVANRNRGMTYPVKTRIRSEVMWT
jgi:hypothetical protein